MPNDNVIYVDFGAKEKLSAEKVLQAVLKTKPESVFLVVWPKDSGEVSYYSSSIDVPIILHNLQKFLHKCYNDEFGEI